MSPASVEWASSVGLRNRRQCNYIHTLRQLMLLIIVLISTAQPCRSHRGLSNADENSEKRVCNVVIFDQVKGYLNWGQEWFKEAAAQQCSTRVVLKESKSPSPGKDAHVVVFHAPTHKKHILPTGRRPKIGSSTATATTGNSSSGSTASNGALFAMFSMEQPK